MVIKIIFKNEVKTILFQKENSKLMYCLVLGTDFLSFNHLLYTAWTFSGVYELADV